MEFGGSGLRGKGVRVGSGICVRLLWLWVEQPPGGGCGQLDGMRNERGDEAWWAQGIPRREVAVPMLREHWEEANVD
jgi:hypothetical protein